MVRQGAEGGDREPEGLQDGARARRAFLLRLPPDLLSDLRSWANQDLRSLNAHIEFLLRQAVKQRKKQA